MADEFSKTVRTLGTKPNWSYKPGLPKPTRHGWQVPLFWFWNFRVHPDGRWEVLSPAHAADSRDVHLGSEAGGFTGHAGSFEDFDPQEGSAEAR